VRFVDDPRLFGPNLIELGSGHFGLEHWRLVYDPVGPPPPDEHHIHGPMVILYVGQRYGGSRLPRAPLPGSLSHPDLFVRSLDIPAYVYGAVDFGFNQVHVHGLKGPPVEATVIECAEHLPFNFYVGEVISRVDRVMASGPDGLTATWARDDSP
jgi:hypothetical protein